MKVYNATIYICNCSVAYYALRTQHITYAMMYDVSRVASAYNHKPCHVYIHTISR